MIQKEPDTFEKEGKGKVSFDHVSFRYPGAEEDVLHDITFTAKPGQTTAFIGSTGSGKSTLVNLIPRFYDVTEGKITIDGKDIRDVAQRDLRIDLAMCRRRECFSPEILHRIFYTAIRMEVKRKWRKRLKLHRRKNLFP